MRTIPTYIGVAALALSAGSGFAALREGAADQATAKAAATGQRSPLRVHGEVDGLYPGLVRWTVFPIRNRSNQRIVVSLIKAKVKDASPTCPAGNLQIAQRRMGVILAPKADWFVRMRVRMDPDADDACQGATFPLKFRARTKAR